MSEHAKVPSGIYGLVPLPDEPKPKKKQESNLEDCLNCEYLCLDDLWFEFYCEKSDTQIHEDDDLVSEEKCKYFRRKIMALARKCDRCGRFYEYYPSGDPFGVWNGIQLIRKSVNDSRIISQDGMDLCCYCMNDLQKFLRNTNMTVMEKKQNADYRA